MLSRLNLNPDYDYRFLGDAAFDTRYVSNVVLNQTGNRYLNGIGSDLAQMTYLMDNAASAQQSLGLQFGVSLTADQIGRARPQHPVVGNRHHQRRNGDGAESVPVAEGCNDQQRQRDCRE
jgi:hypothetical protein